MNRYGFLHHRSVKTILGILADIVSCFLSVFGAQLLLDNAGIPTSGAPWLLFLFATLITVVIYGIFHLYMLVYSQIGIHEVVRIVASALCTTLLLFIFFLEGGVADLLPIPTCTVSALYLYVMGTILCGLTLLSRFFIRFLRFFVGTLGMFSKERKRVMLIGAGAAGMVLLREMRTSDHLAYTPVCIIDDAPEKKGSRIDNIPVVGNTDDIEHVAKEQKIDEIHIAVPSVSNKRRAEILAICQKTGCKVRMLPGIYQLANGEVSVSKLRDIQISDLLGREQISVDLDEIMGYIEGETVLVTGGGGSIGSELCRQIAHHNPKKLIILDIYENNAYDIEQELRRALPNLDILPLIASLRDERKMEDVFRTYRPSIVFNAAAHKHVPLMEISPCEAVKNNVFGTLNVARMADKYEVSRFVQISTDKAVNPTNIMGATKRICEMIIQTVGRHSKTKFVAVRFGNVLGSNGSVIPLFRKQIEEGGPVTVTHKDIVRYFMTIPEAVSLVLQAGAYAEGGQIFVLDMGEQVRIYDLAENLIRLSGYEPNVDIEICVTGLRPGEKLYEERLMEEEGLQRTKNKSISIGQPLDIDEDFLWKKLDELYEAAQNNRSGMKTLVGELVTTYRIPEGQA